MWCLPRRDEAQCLAFYVGVLGMQLERYGENRIALRFGKQKINVHQRSEAVIERLRAHGVPIIAGPAGRSGGLGSIHSVYVRDPDQNLVEIAVPAH